MTGPPDASVARQARADQTQAAAAEHVIAAELFAQHRGVPNRKLHADSAPSWLLALVSSALSDYQSGAGHRCPHLTGGPAPAFSAAWRLDTATCGGCVAMLAPPAGVPSCDHCGAAPPTGVSVELVVADMLVVALRVCGRCRAELLARPPRRARDHHPRRGRRRR
jgi:hypothetical protein